MNAADVRLIGWLKMQVRTGAQTVAVPVELLADASPDGLAEARAYAKICGVELVVEVN